MKGPATRITRGMPYHKVLGGYNDSIVLIDHYKTVNLEYENAIKMGKTITLKTTLPATPKAIYNAWMDSEAHATMTGGSPAIIGQEVGQPFTAHNAYLWGKNLELVPNKKIVQTWRSTGFKSTDEDSHLEVTLEKHKSGTLLTLKHSKVPDQEAHVEEGWVTHYFEPMEAYFINKKK